MINFEVGHGYTGAEKKHLSNFVGTLATKSNEYDIYALDEEETKMFGKNIFRISSPMSEVCNIRELIRFSNKYEMIYFLSDKGIEEGIDDFETRGNKIKWFNVFNKELYFSTIL